MKKVRPPGLRSYVLEIDREELGTIIEFQEEMALNYDAVGDHERAELCRRRAAYLKSERT